MNPNLRNDCESLVRKARYHYNRWISIGDQHAQTNYQVMCSNISQTGIMFLGIREALSFDIGARIGITLYSPKFEEWITTTGHVVRADSRRLFGFGPAYLEYGVFLEHATPLQRAAWQRLIEVSQKELY